MSDFENLKNFINFFGFLNPKESPIIKLSKRLNGKWTEADVICKPGSYGYDKGLFEIKGIDLMTPEECAEDDVVGYLTMENVIARIVKAYKLYKNKG